VLGRTYDEQVCSVARALEVVGERWTLLIVRDALLGLQRFDQLQQSLGIARNVLTDRLNRLVEAGAMERVRYQERPERYEYHLTAMGQQLATPVLALMHWGDDHLAGKAGPPRLVEHVGCGGAVRERFVCTGCGQVLEPEQVDVLPGPALRRRPRRRPRLRQR
jgi:DNA-binding HxlR family transcriptional regulator